MSDLLLREFADAASSASVSLAEAALLIARLEYPRLEPARYLSELDSMGGRAAAHVASVSGDRPRDRLDALNRFVFEELGFAGNRLDYDDPRNSFLNEVLDRRTGIPITLALVYMEIARRASVAVEGVNFPGHFLLRCADVPDLDNPLRRQLLDPFHGRQVSEEDCRELLGESAGDEAEPLDESLLAAADKQQMLVRMLGNLKRTYVRMRSFPHARRVIDLVLALDPLSVIDLRDRGLLAYHQKDYSAALRDLEAYLRLDTRGEPDSATREEHAQMWEHVKALRQRVASLN